MASFVHAAGIVTLTRFILADFLYMNVTPVATKTLLLPVLSWKAAEPIYANGCTPYFSFLVRIPVLTQSISVKSSALPTKPLGLCSKKLRHAMNQAIDSDLLSGIVRVNIAHYGRPHCPIIVPHPQRQPLFIAATMKESGEPCRFKIKHLSKEYLNDGLVRRTGTQLFTEQHVDQTANVDIEYITARFSPRRFHRLLAVAADAGRWINLTFHGIGPKHLQTYMDEYCYRLNLTLRDTPIFHNMLRLSATTAAVPYSVIIQKLACSYY